MRHRLRERLRRRGRGEGQSGRQVGETDLRKGPNQDWLSYHGDYTGRRHSALTEINPSVFNNLRWKIDDFLPLIKGVQAPLVLAAHPSVPANNFAEFLTWAKGNRGKLSYSSYTPGTPSHFLGFLLNEKFDLDLTHVPFNGAAPAITSTIGGHTSVMFGALPGAAPSIKQGQLRALAVTSGKRDQAFPDVPTLAQSGVPDQESEFIQGVFVPTSTPKYIIDKLYREIAASFSCRK